RFDQALFANVNLLRVWGGGIYEKDEFFELCDELGILTWQDFAFACAGYSEDDDMAAEVEAEARDNVGRIVHHPSLVVLNGNNECLWGFDEWSWKPTLRERPWGAGYYYDLLPRVAEELAPHVVYTPGSPFSPTPGVRANDPSEGTAHFWDLWNERDYPAYREYAPRFAAEFGWQGPPTWSTLTASIGDDPLTPESPGMVVHQKAADGNVKLTRGLVAHLDLPDDMEDWHWAMSLNQAVAVTTGVEHFRSLAPLCMGSIVWQLNDCWPVTSWAAVDGYGRPKPLLYALRRAYADRLLTIQPRDGGLVAFLANDSDQPWDVEYHLEHLDYAGALIAAQADAVTVAPRSVYSVAVPQAMRPSAPGRELLRLRAGDHTAHWFFGEYKDSALEEPRYSCRLEGDAGAQTLHVTADTTVRDLSLLVDKVDPDAQVDDMLAVLLPGETASFGIRSARTLSLEELTTPRVLRSANQLVARVSSGGGG
ncbi:MAG: glycoside hydrolase family 2 protein, partial [Dermatophilaceae bacterium]